MPCSASSKAADLLLGACLGLGQFLDPLLGADLGLGQSLDGGIYVIEALLGALV
jgi:hypothetical protein